MNWKLLPLALVVIVVVGCYLYFLRIMGKARGAWRPALAVLSLTILAVTFEVGHKIWKMIVEKVFRRNHLL